MLAMLIEKKSNFIDCPSKSDVDIGDGEVVYLCQALIHFNLAKFAQIYEDGRIENKMFFF
jgi:hypothetical protein